MKNLLLIILLFLMGCETTHDFFKQIEGKTYDGAARSLSEYCEKTDGPILSQERLEARRELRQRGTDGPKGPSTPILGLDRQTAEGQGPVIRIWCEGEEVPKDVWKDFIR